MVAEILSKLAVPLGIATYLMLIATAIGGLRRIPLKYHKRMAFTAIGLATAHALIILMLFL